ncbi:hypothetical protein [Lacticaseibacillus mingshuiensis]|uniref:Uncharacterized protein n=2 Tax=Lacticaseibacillus mingshuiensis TaxID=2799574 RepID=A0ABW4CIC1_9LACO|nr:hypothetical protein [Lacticaseibacillus mingshuiensis]
MTQTRLTNRPRKRRWPKILLAIGLTLIILIGLGVAFFPQVNNGLRTLAGGNTPADNVVKDQIVQRIDAAKNGNPDTDATLDQVASTLKATKMSTIVAAAQSQTKAADLLQSAASLSSTQAKAAAQVLFSESQLQPLREALAKGDFYGAYKAYKTVSETGAAQALKAAIVNEQ